MCVATRAAWRSNDKGGQAAQGLRGNKTTWRWNSARGNKVRQSGAWPMAYGLVREADQQQEDLHQDMGQDDETTPPWLDAWWLANPARG